MAEVRTLLVVGATSDIGRAIARKFAAEGWALQLAARDQVQLAREAEDLQVRSDAVVSSHHCDVLQAQGGAALLDELDPLPDAALCLVGDADGKGEGLRDGATAERIMRTNYIGPALLMAALAERFAQRGSGVLVGVSSVAGDRGRARNYVYGSAKAGLTAFLSGLRSRLQGSGVHVVTVKPGYVHTRMTDGMALPRRLTASPEEVAAAVFGAVYRRRDVVYVRPVWRLIMWVVRAIPEPLFKRLRF